MDLDKIKNLIEKDGGKFIIVEDGEPILTVMSFGDYEKVINGYKNNPFERADSMIDQEQETKKFEQELGEKEDIGEELEPWQTIDKREVEEKYPWQGLRDEIAEKQGNEKEEIEDKEEKEIKESQERKNFLDMPIQAKDEEAELEDLPVR